MTDTAAIRRLIGDDNTPGILDDYTLTALPPKTADGDPLIVWRCDNGCGPEGNGHVGIIARDLELAQTNLTVGEIVDAVLRHRDEDHGAGTAAESRAA